jgi:hypothetical protein
MADETTKPKLEVIEGRVDNNPGSIFDDLASLRKASKLTVQRRTVLVNVAVDKPPNNVYFRCHRDLMLDETTVVRDKKDRTTYYVHPNMRKRPKIAPRLRWVTPVLTSTWPIGDFFLWPVPMLIGDRPFHAWKSERAAYELALDSWVSLVWSSEQSDFLVEPAEGIDHTPIWPERSFEELLKLGFDGKIIDSEEHPYVRRLRGLAD